MNGSSPSDLGGDLTGRRLAIGAALASVLIVLFSAAAVTAAVLLEVDDTKARFFAEAPPTLDLGPTATRAEAGDPRTFLLLGSDRRVEDEQTGRKPRSDTIVLVRADPDRDAVTVLSIPRDLKVTIPDWGTDKINGAYEKGGPKGTVAALERLFEDAGADEPLEINHVLNLDFGGFRRAIGYIGGVYVDVDHRYFNDNNPPVGSTTPYATIDIEPGYQRLGGRDALDYVRYRHGDDDFLRAARQQDFLRQVRGQPSVRKLLRLQDRDRLAAVFGKYIQVDKSFRSTKTLISLLKLGAYLRDARIQSIRFPGVPTDDGVYVEANPDKLREALRQFQNPAAPAAAQRTLERRAKPTPRAPAEDPQPADYRKGLVDARSDTRSSAAAIARRLDFPVLYPTRKTPGSGPEGRVARSYRIETLAGSKYEAYRFVLSTGKAGEYYGVQGTAWRTPPVLVRPDRIQTVGNRRLMLYADGGKLRMVGFRTEEGAYWVSNTLNRSLSNRQMIGLAVSLFDAPGSG